MQNTGVSEDLFTSKHDDPSRKYTHSYIDLYPQVINNYNTPIWRMPRIMANQFNSTQRISYLK